MWQKKIFVSAAILLLALMVDFPAAGLLAGESRTDTTDLSTTESSVLEAYGKMPLLFIENQGQVDEEARYYVTASGQTVYFSEEKKEAVTPLATEEEHGYPCEEDLIEVMFAPDSKVRLRHGELVDLSTNALAGVDDVLDELEWFEWYRTCDVPEEMLDEIQARGENNTGEPVYNLNNIYRLRITMVLDVWAISEELEALPGIIFARPVSKPTHLTTPPDYVLSQGYLRPASSTPSGINADYAWTQPGGDGAGVTVYDLEYSWNYNDADVIKAFNSQINPNPISDPFNDNNHGTAVIGELVSDNNGWGTTGICYGASLRTCGAYYGNSWNPSGAIAYAIADALSNQWPPSVILLEQQWSLGPTPGNQYPYQMYVPIEWWGSYSTNPQTLNPVYAAIVNAVSNGIHVVEAGGNGDVNTDNLTWYGDSGAIIVGGGGAYPGGSWPEGNLERLPFSSYGSRFNLQGWGEDVVTTGYGDLYNSEGVNYWYTTTFAGTSSASPIVAGAVAVIEGVRLASGWPPLSPAAMRSLLVTTGAPQISPPPGNIGPRPDLAQALRAMPVPLRLTVGIFTGGSVTVSTSGPLYNPGTVVRLTATPNARYRFVNWTGDVDTIADVEDATTTITISGNYSITANFVKQYDLTTSSVEGGSVTTPGEGTFTYDQGTVVNLVAEAEEGYRFTSWTGDVDTIGDIEDAEITITLEGNYHIIANFEVTAVCGCFIATAAYGTPMAEEIQILREFRDEYLLTSPLGQALVDLYYKVSPPMAAFITEHPSLKPVVKVGLLPAVAMSTVVVNTTLAGKTAIIGLLALVSVALAVWATRRRGRSPDYT